MSVHCISHSFIFICHPKILAYPRGPVLNYNFTANILQFILKRKHVIYTTVYEAIKKKDENKR